MNNVEALGLLKEVVKMETVLGKEKQVADKLTQVLRRYDIPSEQVRYSEGRHQLVVTLEGAQSGQVLGFSGHMDVVPVGEVPWTDYPFSAVEKEG